MRGLHVFSEGRRVGFAPTGDADRLGFVYDPGWLADGFPISVRLPLRGQPYAPEDAHAFFANLLPEGNARQRICAARKVSVDNDFALLAAIGADCAGALSLVSEDRVPSENEDQYEQLFDAELARLLREGDAFPAIYGSPQTRMSLAGAQDKLGVVVEDDALWLPVGGSPSSHVLKLESASRGFAHLPANEAFTLFLAQALGLPTVECALRTTWKRPVLAVRRYDRVRVDGRWARLHQEDFCQALGLPPTRKYESEGGPTLAQCFEIVRAHCAQPAVALDRLVQWVVANVILGNADGHGKNLSLLRSADGLVLAPFYDLVCTRAYPRMDRSLAMRVGGIDDPDLLLEAHWRAAAADVGVGARVFLDTVRTLAERTPDAVQEAEARVRAIVPKTPVLQTLPRDARRRAKRLLQGLGKR